ncbi:MAG: S8 family serine peptidase [Candidatus Polarisedimenticolia bacterium]
MGTNRASRDRGVQTSSHWRIAGLFFLLATLMIGLTAAKTPPARDAGKPRFIGLNGYRFDPLQGMPDFPESLRAQARGRYEDDYHIVQMNGIITQEMRRGLEKAGAVILHYAPEDAYVVRASEPVMERVRALPFVRWSGLFQPAFKLGPSLDPAMDEKLNRALERRLGKPLAPGKRADSRERLTVQVLAMEPEATPAVTRALGRAGGKLKKSGQYHGAPVRVEIRRAALEALAREPEVLWIERELPVHPFNDVARWTLQSNDPVTHGTPVHDHGLTGEGQIITVADTGLDYKHDAFEDPAHATAGALHRKVTAYYEPEPDQGDNKDNGPDRHGTHVAGSAAGDDGTWGAYDGDGVDTGNSAVESLEPHDGQAFGAKIHVQDLDNSDGIINWTPDPYQLYLAAIDPSRNSWIHTSSWGLVEGSFYGLEDRFIDSFVWNNPDFVALFSAGDEGPARWSINAYGLAKNEITVGSTGNGAASNDVAEDSSRGPAEDGRIKPELMAPGQGIWSARGCQLEQICNPSGTICTEGDVCYDDYKQMSGTSMATPSVAGAAAQVRQYLMDGWYPSGTPQTADEMPSPSGALVKAILINGAREMTGAEAYAFDETKYPNNNQGFGRVHLDSSLHFECDDSQLFLVDNDTGLATNELGEHQFIVGGTGQSLEVTLVWSDYMAMVFARPALVNNLDLEVHSPDGVIYKGNVFRGHNLAESTPQPFDEDADALNNVERVIVRSDVVPGVWTVKVFGKNVPMGGYQPYALAASGRLVTQGGVVGFNNSRYAVTSPVRVSVADIGANANPAVAETVSVNVYSLTDSPQSFTLQENGPNTSFFYVDIPLQLLPTGIPGDGVIQVIEGDTLIAQYQDLTPDSCGSPVSLATAVVDNVPPVISNVTVADLLPRRAWITWETDERSDAWVSYSFYPPVGGEIGGQHLVTEHEAVLDNLWPGTTYVFSVTAMDEQGNTTTNDNGGAYFQFTTPAVPASEQPETEWPGFHNNVARQGASPAYFQPPLTLQTMVPSPTFEGLDEEKGPIVAGGMVYTVSRDGYVRARDANDPETLLWEFQAGDPPNRMKTPLVYQGVLMVVATVGQGFDAESHLVALDAATGGLLWSLPPYIYPWAPYDVLTAADGTLFVIAQNNNVVALRLSDREILWTRSFVPMGPQLLQGGAVVAEGRVFVRTENKFYALDQATGNVLWSNPLAVAPGLHCNRPAPIPMYAQGTIYVPTGSWLCGYPGFLLAIDAATGEARWKFDPYDMFITASTPAYDGKAIYFGTVNPGGYPGDAFYALDATTGDLIWKVPAPADVNSAPIYMNGFVYFPAADGKVHVLEAETGLEVDNVTVDAGNIAYNKQPAAANGRIYVEAGNGDLYVFNAQPDPDDDNDGALDASDCSPLNPAINPGAPEVCDGVDNNCTGGVDETCHISVAPTSQNYGVQAIGDSTPQTFTVSNTGSATLSLGSESISGTHPGDFVITADNCGTSLAPSTNCTVQVSFAPKALGSRSGTLSIPSNALETPLSVPLTGTGQKVAYTLIELPNSDAGPNQGSPTPSGAHYANVDDDPHDGDTSFLSFSAEGHREVYTIADQLLDNDVVKSVTVRWAAKKGSGADWQARAGVIVNGTEYFGTTVNLSSGYVVREETFTNNPFTTQPWTVAEVRAAKLVYHQVTITAQLPKAALTEMVAAVTVHRIPASATLTELPNVDSGPNQGSPTPSGAHWANVDDNPHDSDTSILSFSSGGDKEVFSVADQTLNSDIVTSVKVRWVAKKGSGADWQAKAGLVIGGQEYYGTQVNLTSGYVVREETFTNNPATSLPWTVTEVRAAKLIYQQATITAELPKAALTQILMVVEILRMPLPAAFVEKPGSDAGPNQGQPVPSGAHYLNVDEDPHDGDTTYLQFLAGGHKEVFTTIDQLHDNDIVQSVKVRWVAKKGNGTGWQGKAGLVVNSTEYYGPNVTLPTNYTVREEVFTNNPATGQPWTVAEVRAAKLIYQQTAIVTQIPKARLTEIVLVVKVGRAP